VTTQAHWRNQVFDWVKTVSLGEKPGFWLSSYKRLFHRNWLDAERSLKQLSDFSRLYVASGCLLAVNQCLPNSDLKTPTT
jgi:hypothetical protein